MAGAEKEEVETDETEGDSAAVFTKRTPGTKEVIPLAWKLVGVSGGMPVTLMKCADRDEAETQLKRLEIEGYYGNLGVFPVDAEVPISAALAKARKQAIELAMAQAAKSSKAKSRTAAKQAAGGAGSPTPTKPVANPATETRSSGGKSVKRAPSSARKAAGSTSKAQAKAAASKTAKSGKSTKKQIRKRKK